SVNSTVLEESGLWYFSSTGLLQSIAFIDSFLFQKRLRLLPNLPRTVGVHDHLVKSQIDSCRHLVRRAPIRLFDGGVSVVRPPFVVVGELSPQRVDGGRLWHIAKPRLFLSDPH